MQTSANNLSVFPADTAYTLAVFYKRGDMANRAVAFIEPLWRNVPADYQIELIPREQIELLYPAPYADSLLKFAPERNLDPRFVLSIMRQESRYRADVKSYAAARGLMQFISTTTANQIAGELNRKNFRQDELYNPPDADSFRLAVFAESFPDVSEPAAGGRGELQRRRRLTCSAGWRARNPTSPTATCRKSSFRSRKITSIRVMANYRVYQMIYDEKLKAR